jgi:protein required for attachment to host cells
LYAQNYSHSHTNNEDNSQIGTTRQQHENIQRPHPSNETSDSNTKSKKNSDQKQIVETIKTEVPEDIKKMALDNIDEKIPDKDINKWFKKNLDNIVENYHEFNDWIIDSVDCT